MLWIAFTLIGTRISLLLKKRQKLLDDTLTFLNKLIVSIQYSRSSIVEIISETSFEASEEKFSLTEICAEEIKNGKDFPEAWKRAVCSTHLYKSEEKTKLLQLGTFIGTSDYLSQINTINLYLSYFNAFLKDATGEYEKYGMTSSLFGLFIGAVAFIMLF